MDDSVRVIDRVFAILEYLSKSNAPRGPTDIAAVTGMHKSTVHRLLSSMYGGGYIEKTDEGTYHIGVKLVGIVSNHINNLELQTEARPYLNDLHAELGLIVHLGILDGAEVIYVEKIDIERNLRVYAQIGMRVPTYCSSLGKCLIARLSGDELNSVFTRHTLERFTPNTITSLHRLKECLREVRRQGWAMDNEEYIVGHRCIGAPIFDYRGEVIAAVSASGPSTLLNDERIPKVKESVIQTAKRISHRLCYQE